MDFFISIVHVNMSRQFEEYLEAQTLQFLLPKLWVAQQNQPCQWKLIQPYPFFVLCDTRTDTDTLSTKARSKRCKHFLFNTGVLVILQVLVRDTKTWCTANTPVAGKRPSYSQSPGWDQCEGWNRAAGAQEHVISTLSTYCPKPRLPGGLGPPQGMWCLPLPARGKAESIQTKASS